MVKGRQGFYLEAWKFGVYVSIPVIASAYFSDPQTIKEQAKYWKFIEYPENPNTNVRQKILKLAKEKEERARKIIQDLRGEIAHLTKIVEGGTSLSVSADNNV